MAGVPSLTRSSQGDRASRRAAISGRLMAATEQLLADDVSFTELSVERLCKAADVSRSTFYAYFDDKGHLLRELSGDVIGRLGDIAREWWSVDRVDREELESILLRLAGEYHAHGALLGAVADTAVYDPEVREVFDGLVGAFIDEITRAIERGNADGSMRVGASARETAELLTWMTVHSYYQEVRGADAGKVERIAAANAEVIWKTLYDGA